MHLLRDRTPASKRRFVFMVGTFVTAIANTVALLLIARSMGPEILGGLGFMLSFIGLFFFVGDMGNAFAFTKLLDKGYKFRECYSAYLWAKIKLTVLLGILSGIMIGVYLYFQPADEYSPVHPLALILILGYFLLANIAQIWVVSLNAKRKKLAPNIYDALESVIKVALVAGIISFAFTRGTQEAVFELAVVYLLAAIMGLMIVRNTARRFKRMPISDEISVEFHDTSRIILPHIALAAIILNLDKVMLWYFYDFDTVGVYFAAQRITIFIAASAIAVQGLVGRPIASYLRSGDRKSVSEIIRLLERYITLMGIPVAAFYIFFADDILVAFLGNEFAGAGLTVGLLVGAGLFTALAASHVLYMIQDEKYKELMISTGLAFLTFLMLIGLLLPPDILPFDPGIYGMDAAALALLASSIVGFACYRIYTYHNLKCSPHPRILAHILCAGLMVAVLNFTTWYFDIIDPLHRVLICSVLGVFIYGLFLYLVGEFLRDDYKRFKVLTRDEN